MKKCYKILLGMLLAVSLAGCAEKKEAEETVVVEIAEEAVEMEVEVPIEYQEEVEVEVEVPYTETVTNEDGTTSEVQKTKIEKQKQMQTVTKMEKKKTTIMEKKTRSEVTVAQKDMVINVGFVNKSDYALSFMFVYDAVGGSNSQELVDLLLKSGSFGYSGSALKLE